MALTETTYPVTIGAGGNPVGPGSSATPGNKGNDTSFNSITSEGGGAATHASSPDCPVNPGGSGGASHDNTCPRAGNDPPVSPPQGNPGGASGSYPSPNGNTTGGAGGNGHPITAFASTLFPTMPAAWISAAGPTGLLAGGGGGGQWGDGSGPAGGGGGGAGSSGTPSQSSPPTYGGAGGPGGGGAGGIGPTGAPTVPRAGTGTAGTTNSGGGGGGGGGENVTGAGGSGIVIIRYPS